MPALRPLLLTAAGSAALAAGVSLWLRPAAPTTAAPPMSPGTARPVPLDLAHALHRAGADVWGFDVPAGCALEVVETRPGRRPERVAGHAPPGQGASRVFVLVDDPPRRGGDPAGPVRVTVAGSSGSQTATRPHPVADYSERSWNRDPDPEVNGPPKELVAFAPIGPDGDARRVGYAVRVVRRGEDRPDDAVAPRGVPVDGPGGGG